MSYRRHTTRVTAVVACALGLVLASATSASASVATITDRGAETASGQTAHTSPQTAANPADTEFIRMMIPHHYQAVVMTQLAPDRSADEEILSLAERINTEQVVEIDTMRGWQGRNGLPVTDPEESYQRLLQDPERLEDMGMATSAEMDELRAADGNDFDVLFLQLMIPHHEGAVVMSEEVIINGSDMFVRQMATDIMAAQSEQIRTMEDMLQSKKEEEASA